jgi:hypothetical protein
MNIEFEWCCCMFLSILVFMYLTRVLPCLALPCLVVPFEAMELPARQTHYAPPHGLAGSSGTQQQPGTQRWQWQPPPPALSAAALAE